MPSPVILTVVAPDHQASFDPSIPGVATITREGTEVPASKAKAVKAAALSHGVTLK